MKSPFGASEQHQYFLEIEALFNSLRGSAALLSPADWKIAKGWFDRGLPIGVVRSALENVFVRRRERDQTRSVQSLSYCESAVDNAFRHLQELGYGTHDAEEVPKSINERLARLVESLKAYGATHAAAIMACGEGASDPAEVERRLTDLERRLTQVAWASLSDADRALKDEQIEARVLDATQALRSRLDPETHQRTVVRTRERLEKELAETPRLSLFL